MTHSDLAAARGASKRPQPLADPTRRIEPLDSESAVGLRALAFEAAADRLDMDELRKRLVADIDAMTWKRWLAAYGRLG